MRGSSFKRRVWCRANATSTGERPANGFPLVAVRGGGGVKSAALGFLLPSLRFLRETMEAFLGSVERFLRVAEVLSRAVFGCM